MTLNPRPHAPFFTPTIFTTAVKIVGADRTSLSPPFHPDNLHDPHPDNLHDPGGGPPSSWGGPLSTTPELSPS
jgi:hypothetical protein